MHCPKMILDPRVGLISRTLPQGTTRYLLYEHGHRENDRAST